MFLPAPRLDDTRWDDLVEQSRALLPLYAPEWTDHNLSDPGITLLDLLAWTSEAQLYSLARMRRDERRAYAAMLGIDATGPTPARGAVWPDAGDPASPFARQDEALVIGANARVSVDKGGDLPVFRPTHPILWVPGTIAALATESGHAGQVDHAADNASGRRDFAPFGRDATPTDRLRLTFDIRGTQGLFPRDRTSTKGALFALGVQVDGTMPADATAPPLLAVVEADGLRTPVRIVEDSSAGMLRSGVLLFDFGDVPGSPARIVLELRPAARYGHAPRVRALQPNVLPIEQSAQVVGESHSGNGQPGQRIRFDTPGLRHGPGIAPVRVRVADGREDATWLLREDLRDAGPDDRVFALDTRDEAIVFGNGINGRLPPAGASIVLHYAVSAGVAGNLGRRKGWRVQGLDGTFGVNPEPMAGGRDATSPVDSRREARTRTHEAHALVTAADIEAAALALDDLAVARVRVLDAAGAGELRLVAMRRRAADEPEAVPEHRAWRDAIRARLAPRMPLGTRLQVRAPAYVRFVVQATLRARAGFDPAQVAKDAMARLVSAFVPETSGEDVLASGRDVSMRDVAAQLREVTGVARVSALELRDPAGGVQSVLRVPPHGLAWLDRKSSKVVVERPSSPNTQGAAP